MGSGASKDSKPAAAANVVEAAAEIDEGEEEDDYEEIYVDQQEEKIGKYIVWEHLHKQSKVI